MVTDKQPACDIWIRTR